MPDRPLPARWVSWLSTWFGCGYAKKAPGTVGSLGALPLFALLQYGVPNSAFLYWAVVVALCALGTLAADRFARATGTKDPQQVVIDEVAGVLIALGFVRSGGPLALAVAWVLFRALDILKPWPISLAEKAKPPGLGIMLDDLVAGFFAGLAALLVFLG
jgi:phosphatidylglycerophosphatase A